jgi:hypothetical protein
MKLGEKATLDITRLVLIHSYLVQFFESVKLILSSQ